MKIFRYIYILTLLSLFVGCQSDGEESDAPSDIDMSLESFNASRSDGVEWSSGDSVGVVMISHEGSSVGIDRECYVASSSGADVLFSSDTPISYLDDGESYVVAYYPYSFAINDHKSLDIDVREEFDHLLVSAMKSGSYKNDLDITLHPLLAQISFSVEAVEGYDSSKLEGMSLSLSGLTPCAEYDLELEEFTFGEVEEFELQSTTTRSDVSTDFSASIIPQSATEAYVNFTFADGSSYSLSLDVATLSSGMVYTYSASVSDSGVELQSLTITSWGDGGSQSGVASVIPSGYTAIYDEADFREHFIVNVSLKANYILMADLSLGSDWSSSQGISSGYIFDGNGHTITYGISSDIVENGHALFHINNGTIRNLSVAGDLDFTGGDYSEYYFGGVAYKNGNSGVIQNCTSSLNVKATKLIRAGGIATVSLGTIVNCCNLGDIKLTNGESSDTHVGGITGHLTPSSNSYTAMVKNVFNAGDIELADGVGYCGNIIGYADESYLKSGNIVFDYLFCSVDYNDVNPIGNSSDIDYFDYLYLTGKAVLYVEDEAMRSVAFVEILNNEAYSIAEDDGIDGLKAWKLGTEYPELDTILAPYYTSLSTGLGTAEYPYIISTAQQLVDLSSEVAAGDDKTDVYYTLLNNVYLIGLSSDWVPIGTSDTPFQGHFGSISGNMQSVTLNIETYDVQFNSLFGVVGESGYIHDIEMKGSIIANYYCASVASINYGTVTGCNNYATVHSEGAYSYVGGLVAVNMESGTVSDCVNEAKISEIGYYVTIGTVVGVNAGTTSNISSTVSATHSGNSTKYTTTDNYIIGSTR